MDPAEKVAFWSSRSSFTDCADLSIPDITVTSEPDKERPTHLIQLKSPSTPTATDTKLTDDQSPRRKSVEVAELHRVDKIQTLDRFSTCLTPTATSFSREELNEIFNIGRNNNTTSDFQPYDKMRSPKQQHTADENLNSSENDVSMHNVAMNHSNISLDDIDISMVTSSPNNSPGNDEKTSSNASNTGLSQTPQSNSKGQLAPLDLQDISNLSTPKNCITPSSPSTPFTPLSPDNGRSKYSKLQMVCREIFMTEKAYVNDLQEVIEGYIYHLKQQIDLDVESIFGNLEDIYEFNKDVLYELEQCENDDYEIDPINLAKVFIDKARGFNHHYVSYCTNYPEASSFFSIIMQDPNIHQFFLERQKVIGHALPLESYLLKPVQRIMKYHLLFRDILKKYDGDEDGYNTINTAVFAMSDVAEYINEMKRLHENAVKVQQILSQIVDLDVPIDVFATGRLVLEEKGTSQDVDVKNQNAFKVQGARGDRIMYLFEKLLLICKRAEDNLYSFKEKIECSNMMLVESLPKDPLAFQIMRFDNQKVNYTIIAKTLEIKKTWTQHLKRLILENHAAMIPQTARQAILGTEEKKSKYNSLPINALDDSVMGNILQMKSKGNLKTFASKENVAMPTGVKRESNEKEAAHAPKRSLNVKAKEYLMEKKSRSNLLNQQSQPSPDKSTASDLSEMLFNPMSMWHTHYQNKSKAEKKEKKWKKKHHKNKPSLDNILLVHNDVAAIENSPDTPEHSRIKSRSLESLKDNIRLQQDENEESTDRSILQEIINHDFEKDDTKPNSRPISMAEVENLTDDIILTQTDTVKDANENNEDTERKTRRVSKSMSLNMPKKDDSRRWSKLSENDPMEMLEKRLSILNDDEISAASIKNMVRKVSNAFNSSFQAYDELPKADIDNDVNVSRDLGLIFGSPATEKLANRRSTGDIVHQHRSSIRIRSRSALSVNDKPKRPLLKEQLTDENDESESTTEEVSSDVNETHRWSADVDQVFDEVNADLSSIADSISSETNKSNESVSSEVTATTTNDQTLFENRHDDSQTTSGMDINKRVALVDQRLKLANEEQNMSPGSARKINVEVKRVADRIKEYKRLIDAEKQRNSWRRREPRTITEMMETLDSISTVTNGLSPVYASHRRRFKSSRDFEPTNGDRRSSEESTSSATVIRSFSETFNPEVTRGVGAESDDQNDLIPSESNPSDHQIDNSVHETSDEDKTTQKIEQIKILRSNSKSTTPNELKTNDETEEQEEIQLDGKQWETKANSLPNPRRTNAFKRTPRQMSEDLSSNNNRVKTNKGDKTLHKSQSLESKRNSRPMERLKTKTSKWVESANNKKNLRSSSVPPENRHSMPPQIIHEEVLGHSKRSHNTRLPNRRTSSDCSETMNEPRKTRGRPDTVKSNQNSSKENSTKYMSLPRTKKKAYNEKSDKKKSDKSKSGSSSSSSESNSSSPYTHRSTSLPRRAKKLGQIDFVKREVDANHNNILRSPSIRCIQQNHVNARIKDYFTNMNRSTQISRSRPNLLLVGSDSEDENNSSSGTSLENDDGNISPTPGGTNQDHILRGTVRSMIKRYGQSNYVFDKF